MFTVVRFRGRKKLIYRYKKYLKQTKYGYYTEIILPPAKNNRQIKRLSDILSEYSGSIIYEKNHFANAFEAMPYPTSQFCDRVLIHAFYEYCKKMHPDCAVINPQGKIQNDFYLKLSNYVGRLVILCQKPDYELCRRLLNYSGTPLFFDNSVSNGAILLDLSDTPLNSGGVFTANFQKNILQTVADSFIFEENNFNGLEPISLSAAMVEKLNRRDLIKEWSTAVNNLFF